MISAARDAYGSKKVEESIKIHQKKAEKKASFPAEAGHKLSRETFEQFFAAFGSSTSRGLVFSLLVVDLAPKCHKMLLPLLLGMALYFAALAHFSKKAATDVEQFGEQNKKKEKKFFFYIFFPLFPERARETWELENFPEGEIQEMVELFEEKGYTSDQAKQVVAILSTRKTAFVEFMMVEELGILPSPSSGSVWLHSVISVSGVVFAGKKKRTYVLPCV